MAARLLLRAGLAAALSTAVVSTPVALKRDMHSETQMLADPNWGPIPGEDPIFNDYFGVAPTWPGNLTDAILPTANGAPEHDDRIWQNLLAAEWIIFWFYQQAIEMFTDEDFAAAGLPNTTMHHIMEIRNNEAGHLRIFQNQISPNSVKPGSCKYNFPYKDPLSFFALMTILEVSAMTFLTGLVQQLEKNPSKGAMLAIATTETRHEVWVLMDVWKENPFGGPSDTVFPYADEVLDSTAHFQIPGSCPPENPEYPMPRQHLPGLSAAKHTESLAPGSVITLSFTDPDNQPVFDEDKDYYVVFFHGVSNETVPIYTCAWPEKNITVQIPPMFEQKGVIAAVVADAPGAPTKESVVAGPGLILQQPAKIGVALLG